MVIQELRRANTRGSPTAPPAASLVRTRANDEAAAAQPASATTHTLDRLGARTAPILASDASADAAMSLTPFSHASAVNRWTEPLRRNRSCESRNGRG